VVASVVKRVRSDPWIRVQPWIRGIRVHSHWSNKISRFFYNVENFEFFLLLRFLLPVVVTKTYSQ